MAAVTNAHSSPRFAPPQRTAEDGRWQRPGNGTYEAVVEPLILFDGVPCTRGVQRLQQVSAVVDANHRASTAKVDIFDANGVRVPPVGCAVATA